MKAGTVMIGKLFNNKDGFNTEDMLPDIRKYLRMLAGAISNPKSRIVVDVRIDSGIRSPYSTMKIKTVDDTNIIGIMVSLPTRILDKEYTYMEATGLMMHDIGHGMFSKDQTKAIHNSVLSNRSKWALDRTYKPIYEIMLEFTGILEDLRVNAKMREYFRQSKPFIKEVDRASILLSMDEKSFLDSIKSMTNLWLRTKGVNTTKLMGKKMRMGFSNLIRGIKNLKPESKPSTDELFKSLEPIFWDNLYLFNDNNYDGNNSNTGHNKNEWGESPQYQDTDKNNPSDGNGNGESNEEKDESLGGAPQKYQVSMGDNKKPMMIGNSKIVYPKQDTLRPMEPEVERLGYIESDDNRLCIDDGVEMLLRGKSLGRKLRKTLIISEEEEYRKTSGRLDVRQLRRDISKHGIPTSPKIFKRGFKTKHLHSVGVLIDMSGSMMGSYGVTNTRYQAAKRAVLMLNGCMEELNVKHFICGFGAKDNSILIQEYMFKDMNGMMDIKKFEKAAPRMDSVYNRDSSSIRLGAKRLLQHGRGKRILFVVSDGLPYHNDVAGDRCYTGLCKADIDRALWEAKMMGVTVVGVGITTEAHDFINKHYEYGFAINHEKVATHLPEEIYNAYMTVVNPTKR